MGTSSNSKIISKLPKSGIYTTDEEKEKIIKNAIGIVNFKELMMESLSKEFLTLFKENSHLFYCQSFLEGISFEYGLFDKSMNKSKAFSIYKEGADLKNDYLCMYRLHRIFLVDYQDFELERNMDLDKLYLYKCFAYLPYMIIDRNYYLLNKIDVCYEIALCLDTEDSNLDKFYKFLDFLEKYKDLFHLSLNDILLMKYVINAVFFEDKIKNNMEVLDNFLNFIKGDDAYYEGQLKYCNFYIKFSEKECDKEKINDIFNNLVNAEYYKAFFDYGNYLIKEEKFDEARNIFKKGADKSQQFCLGTYNYIILRESDLNQILSDYNLTSYLLKNMCLTICIEKLDQGSFKYFIYYLLKHSSLKKQIGNDFIKYAFEIIAKEEQICQVENNQFLDNNFAEKYFIQVYKNYGNTYYYGINNHYFKSSKEKAILYFIKSYKLAKEKDYDYLKRTSYLYIYKCRKILYKNNRISLRKLNKTKDKLFMKYENSDIKNLNSLELYNYYKLYKINVSGNITDKLIFLLKTGKNIKMYYSFIDFIYKEKCKKALEEEYLNLSNFNQSENNMRSDSFDKNNRINIYFAVMDSINRYKLTVSKESQFIKVIHKLYNNYPELEEKKISSFLSQGDRINLFETVEENKLNENSIILMINK